MGNVLYSLPYWIFAALLTYDWNTQNQLLTWYNANRSYIDDTKAGQTSGGHTYLSTTSYNLLQFRVAAEIRGALVCLLIALFIFVFKGRLA
jgi:hypothetical protein